MKLLYFVQYFPPEQASGLFLVMEMLEGFAKHGWEVEVYTATPTRGVSEEVRNAYKRKRVEELHDGKVTIHRMPLYREGTGFIQRTIRYCIFSIQCLLKGLFVPADMIFTGGGPPTQGIVAGLIHKFTKKKVVYNPQDLFPDSMIFSGLAREDSVMVKLWRYIEKFSYKNADKIITISEDMKETILKRCNEKDKVHVVHNWIDTDVVKPVSRRENLLFDELGLSRSKFYVTYAGNLGLMQGIDTIIQAAKILKDYEHIQFVIFGNGSQEEHIRALIAEEQMKNLHLYPLQPSSRVSEVYSLGSMSIISCKAGTSKVGMPSKIGSIMAAGTGVIASFDLGGELERIINEAQCGVCVGAGDAKELADAILQMQNTTRWGENARKYAVEFLSKDKAIAEYIRLIETLVIG